MFEKWSAYIDDFGSFALLARVNVQIVGDPIIHSTVELHLGSFLYNCKISISIIIVIKFSEALETLL